MALTWFELEVGYPTGPKAQALKALLRQPHADAYPVRLWAYCYMQEVARFEGPAAVGIIETAAGWRGAPGALVAALTSCGFLDTAGDAYEVHGVRRRLEEAWFRRDAAAKRQRKHRDSSVTNASVTRDSRVSHGVSHAETDRPTRPTNQEAQASARVPNAVQEAWDREHPANAALLASLKAAGKPLTKSLRADVTIGIERATKELGVERAMRVVLDAYDRDPNPSIGWYASALHRASAAAATRETPKPSEPLPAPDPAFLDAHPGSREVWAEYEKNALSKATSEADKARLLGTALFLFTAQFETEAA